MRRVLCVAALVAAAGAGACDPCDGLSACGEPTAISYQGKVVAKDGRPQANVTVGFRRYDGIALARDSFAAVTNRDGEFTIHEPAATRGTLLVDIGIDPPDSAGPRPLGRLELRTAENGDRLRLPDLPERPHVAYQVALWLRATRKPLANASIRFVRTGGVGLDRPEIRATATAGGNFWIKTDVHEGGELVGELTVTPAGRATPLEPIEMRLPTLLEAGQEVWYPFGVGPNWGWIGRVTLPDGTDAVGIDVAFQRTGGLPIASDSFEVRSNEHGLFALYVTPLDPYEGGEVVGRLHIRPPAPYQPVTVDDFRLESYQSDELRLRETWVLAPAAPDTAGGSS